MIKHWDHNAEIQYNINNAQQNRGPMRRGPLTAAPGKGRDHEKHPDGQKQCDIQDYVRK